MNDLFLQDDIMDVLKSQIDIREYDKLKRVSLKYKRYFDLKPLVDSKKYEDIMIIRGCSIEILANIITKHVIAKYNYADIKEITEQILKYKNNFSMSLQDKGHYILQSLITLYYNCYNNNYKGIIMSLWSFRNNCYKMISKDNYSYFIQPIISYIEDMNGEITLLRFNNYDEYDDIVNNKMLIYINLNIYLSIVMKSILAIIPDNTPKILVDVINNGVQEIVLDYIDFNINALSYPNYYITYVKYIYDNIML
jgi:hypothetical protein